MLKQKLNTSEVRADQVANQKLQTLKLGLDVHADSIVVVRILDHSAPQPAQKFAPAKFLAWIQTQLPLAGQVHSCYEAGPFGFGLHRDLMKLGVRNLVVQPVCLDEQHKGVNHVATIRIIKHIFMPYVRLRPFGWDCNGRPPQILISGHGPPHIFQTRPAISRSVPTPARCK
jgi:hypothetical protein